MAAVRIREDVKSLSGAEKAALFILSLGEEYAARVFTHMNDDEINQKSYDLSDMTLGAVFGVGLNLMLGDQYALRLDGRYYWESERYFALGLAIQKEF